MDDKLTMQCWEDLANAVVLQALEDYRDICLRMRKRPDLRSLAKQRRSLECFFRSRRCAQLSAMDVRNMVKEIQKGDWTEWMPEWKGWN